MNRTPTNLLLLCCLAVLGSCIARDQTPTPTDKDAQAEQPDTPSPTVNEKPAANLQDRPSVAPDKPAKTDKPAAPENSRKLLAYEERILSLLYPDDILKAANICVGSPEGLPEDSIWPLIVLIALQNDCAITVGANIYFPSEPDTSTTWGMQWLAHEIRHVQQYDQAGGLDNFLTAYAYYVLLGYFSEGPSSAYINNPFENDARVYQAGISRLLSSRPELYEAMKQTGQARDTSVKQLVKQNAAAYGDIIKSALGRAQVFATTFEVAEDENFTIDFHLRGPYTEPVGKTIDLKPKPVDLPEQ